MSCSISGLKILSKLVSELACLMAGPAAYCTAVSTVLCHPMVAFIGFMCS